jgi:hypothetical protein
MIDFASCFTTGNNMVFFALLLGYNILVGKPTKNNNEIQMGVVH